MQRLIQRLLKAISGNLCAHTWEITFANRVTLAPMERRCTRCGQEQRAHTDWKNKD